MSSVAVLTTSPRRVFIPNLMGRQMITVNLAEDTTSGEDKSSLDLLHFEDAGYASSGSEAGSASSSRSASPAPSFASQPPARRIKSRGFIPADAF